MKRKQDLFHLIKAMSKSEKRYFTLDAQKSSGKKASKYFELFKAINAMDEEYDESKLKKKFPKNLSADKAYLYDAILRSMRDYRSSKSVAARIKEMVLDAKYLYERGLYQQSEDRLNDAKSLAISIDDQLSLLEINQEERALAWVTQKDNESKFHGLIEEKNINLSALDNYFNYYDISSELIIGMKKGHYKDKKSLILDLESKIDFEVEPASPRAKQKYYLTLALYYQNQGDLNTAATYYSKIVDIWEEYPAYKNEEPFRYVHDISNLLDIFGRLDNVEQLPGLIQKLEEESHANTHIKGATFYIINIYKLMYLINTGEKHDVKNLVEEIEKGLYTFKMNEARQIALIFNATILLFVNEKFELSYDWCKKVIKKIKSVNQLTGLWPSYFLKLLSANASNDRELLDKEIRFIDRAYAGEIRSNNHDQIGEILEAVKNVFNAPLLEINARIKDLKQLIEQYQLNNQRILPLGTDELILLWAESKLSRKTMTQLLAEQRKAKSMKAEVGN